MLGGKGDTLLTGAELADAEEDCDADKEEMVVGLEIVLRKTTKDGADVEDYIKSWDDLGTSENSGRGTLVIKNNLNSTSDYCIFKITGSARTNITNSIQYTISYVDFPIMDFMKGIKPILIAVSMYPLGPGSLPSKQITTVGFVGQL